LLSAVHSGDNGGMKKPRILQRFSRVFTKLVIGNTAPLVDDEFLDELSAILVKTEGHGLAKRIRDRIHRDFHNRKVEMSELLTSVRDELRAEYE